LLLCAAALLSAACGAAESEFLRAPPKPEPDSQQATRYAQALRLAALARVEARAGLDEMAAEHYRAAWRQQPEAAYLVAAAEVWERAGRYAEAHETAVRALGQALSDAERTRVGGEAARLKTLVPQGLVRVAVQARPEGARLVLTQAGKKAAPGPSGQNAQDAIQRVVLGTGHLWLQPGLWDVEVSAKGFQSHLMTFQAGGADGELLAVALKPEETGPTLVRVTPEGEGTPKKLAPDKPGPDEIVGPEAIPGVEPEKEPRNVAEPGPTLELEYEPRKPSRGVVSRYGPLVLSALGVLGMGAGGGLGYQLQQDVLAFNEAHTGSEADYKQQLADFRTKSDQQALYVNASFAGSGVLLAAGTLWWALQPKARFALAPSASAVAAAAADPAVQRLRFAVPADALKQETHGVR
jgi:hypothetical protein